ncbi:hypothetical protein TTHERM_00624479 (macronuclear) [Tetrahymena thermophila SB210]|uniref:Uncharacterized protein n=1 Tax=Tetrahymena thermophila (strain SB210) TaxID=312017 RepID=A4VD48_TETTS|nr:hypothetical protein TTHERM_00624479 [Tetrahymena thermophila SB210]EDK31455.1 hypothetical protein TTHERM_00624479 [Tetrahymena thermophila SB210]|eukprot:XP_001471443.1 hypothetical protein TTHERM_00624479 [Tetrahymena thermophila SB210]
MIQAIKTMAFAVMIIKQSLQINLELLLLFIINVIQKTNFYFSKYLIGKSIHQLKFFQIKNKNLLSYQQNAIFKQQRAYQFFRGTKIDFAIKLRVTNLLEGLRQK